MPAFDPTKHPGVTIHESCYIDDPCTIGKGSKIWHFSHVMKNCKIGEKCNLGQNVVVSPDVVLGNNVKVQNNVSIYTGVEIEDDVFCGPSMVFTNILVPRSEIVRRDEYVKTMIRKGASMGANCTIVCGIEVGRYALIGSGAVVPKNVPNYALMVGVPAKRIGWVCRCGYTLPKAGADKTMTCAHCSNHYREEGSEKLTPLKEVQGS
ncbi:MAG TPA: acyltransferase [Phycisphaerales bacterium]|nr:acyltransferase [Phycisphaerales bacterium]